MSRSASRKTKHDNKLNNQVDYRWILKRLRQTTHTHTIFTRSSRKNVSWSKLLALCNIAHSFRVHLLKDLMKLKWKKCNKNTTPIKTKTTNSKNTYIWSWRNKKSHESTERQIETQATTTKKSSQHTHTHTHYERKKQKKTKTQQRAENNITNKKLSARKYMSIHFEKTHAERELKWERSKPARENEPWESAWWTKRPNANHEAKHFRAQHIFEINVKP